MMHMGFYYTGVVLQNYVHASVRFCVMGCHGNWCNFNCIFHYLRTPVLVIFFQHFSKDGYLISYKDTWHLYVQMGQVIMHGRRGPTRRNVSRCRSTWCLAQYLPSAGKRLWNSYLHNNSIGFDNSHCIWKPTVWGGAILYPLRHRADVESMVWFLSSPMLHLSDHWVGLRDESKSFEIIFLCRSVRQYFNLLIGAILVTITLCQICHSYNNAGRQFVAHCASNFNCRFWGNLRTSEHINRLECIIGSNILYLFSVLLIVECWYNTVFFYSVLFLP